MDLLGSEIALGFDMHGCPNRCRHCWYPDDSGVDEPTVRRVAKLFRQYVPAGQSEPMFKKLWVSTAVQEPDFAPDYRRLHELECELSDGPPWRYELLSIWRLARDPQYAAWAKSVGPDACQITFFGEEATTDWFTGRAGAFADALAATERLLEAGMKPRWQLFANTRGIDEFPSLLRRIDALRLRQRVEQLGGRFDVFMHTWSPNGRNLAIEHLRPTEADMQRIPPDLIESSRRHFGEDALWGVEADMYQDILSRPAWHPYSIQPSHIPWFVITGSLDVYLSACGLDPWWRLGNIGREDVGAIVNRLLNHDTPGLRTVYSVPPQDLARAHCQKDGRQVFSSADDLLSLCVAKQHQLLVE
jgi:hypothetical protein